MLLLGCELILERRLKLCIPDELLLRYTSLTVCAGYSRLGLGLNLSGQLKICPGLVGFLRRFWGLSACRARRRSDNLLPNCPLRSHGRCRTST
jgi:hypothetical protein